MSKIYIVPTVLYKISQSHNHNQPSIESVMYMICEHIDESKKEDKHTHLPPDPISHKPKYQPIAKTNIFNKIVNHNKRRV